MKGRLYDAEIGRFISADPYVQAATDTQSYNRYSYVRNNPLSLTGLSKLWKGIKRFVKKWGRTILAIAATIFTAGAFAAYGAIIAGAAGGFVGGLISTGSLSGALKGALFGALSAGLASKIGHGYDKFFGRFGRSAKHAKAVAHGIAQGTVSVLKGGKFGAGFVSAFGAKISGIYTEGLSKGTQLVTSVIVGGTTSKLVGGKFANGAVTAAFVTMFNDWLDKKITVGAKGKGLHGPYYPKNATIVMRIRAFLAGQLLKVVGLGVLKVDAIKLGLKANWLGVTIGIFIPDSIDCGTLECAGISTTEYIGPPRPLPSNHGGGETNGIVRDPNVFAF